MKKLLSIILLATLSLGAAAWTPRISYGLEWGYTGTFLKTWQYNYIYSAGSRLFDNGSSWRYFSNGSFLADAGLDISPKVNLSVYSGILGVYSRRWMVPVELRARWCPAGLEENGPLLYSGAAVTFPTSTLMETSGRLNIGGGYRVKIYRHITADLLMAFHFTFDHDIIYDPDTDMPVPRTDMVSNLSEFWGLNVSFAINF